MIRGYSGLISFLAARRMAIGMSQQMLAEAIGMKPSHLRQIEAGGPKILAAEYVGPMFRVLGIALIPLAGSAHAHESYPAKSDGSADYEKISKEFRRRIGRKGARTANHRIGAEGRRRNARHAARCRWAKHRPVKRKINAVT